MTSFKVSVRWIEENTPFKAVGDQSILTPNGLDLTNRPGTRNTVSNDGHSVVFISTNGYVTSDWVLQPHSIYLITKEPSDNRIISYDRLLLIAKYDIEAQTIDYVSEYTYLFELYELTKVYKELKKLASTSPYLRSELLSTKHNQLHALLTKAAQVPPYIDPKELVEETLLQTLMANGKLVYEKYKVVEQDRRRDPRIPYWDPYLHLHELCCQALVKINQDPNDWSDTIFMSIMKYYYQKFQ